MSSKEYKYTPLTGDRQIRLLKLESAKSVSWFLPKRFRASSGDPELSVDLVTVSLDAAPPFEAISYAWGDPLPRHEIRCSGRRAEIGPNLYSALYHLRRRQRAGQSPWVWADAICINQDDIAERESQVRMMGDIYSAASVTLIWLGEEDKHITRAFDWLGRFHRVWQPFLVSLTPMPLDTAARECTTAITGRLLENFNSEAQDILQAAFGDWSSQTNAFQDIWMLLTRPWFMRKWVIQEVAKSRHHRLLFLAGEKWTEWAHLKSWFAFLRLNSYVYQRFHESCPWGVDYDVQDDTNTHTVFQRGNVLAQITLEPGGPLCRLLAVTGMFKCGDPRDHIIALLGVAKDGSMLQDLVDYKASTDDLWRRLVDAHLNNGIYLKVLWSTLTIVTVEKRRGSSWVPHIEEMQSRIATSDSDNVNVHWWRMADAGGRMEIDATSHGNRLLIRGRIVDVVEQLGTDVATAIPESNRPNHDMGFTAKKKRQWGPWANWLDECHTMANYAHQDEQAFIDIMLMETFVLDYLPAEAIAAAKKGFPRFRGILEAFASAPDESTWERTWESLDPDLVMCWNALKKFLMCMQSRRFGRTQHGRIGWMPLVAEEGDQICVFDGMEFPYAVRQRQGSEGNYVLVGDCLIPSLLNGEAMDMPGVESVIITLE